MVSGISLRKQVLVGVCAALMVVFSQITIPLPFSVVPITLQTFAVMLIAIVLEAKLATVTLGIYTLLGCIGLPVFAGFSGGLHTVVGPTGGFIIGFIVMAFIIGWASKTGSKIILWIGTYVGLMMDYILGVVQLAFVAHMSLNEALVAGAYPFLPKDLILAAVAVGVASRIKVMIKKAVTDYAEA